MKFTSILFGAALAKDAHELFAEFEAKFNKKYESDEERERRRDVFAANLPKWEALQAKERGTAVYSHLSPLADWSEGEFNARNNVQLSENRKPFADPVIGDALPASFDWREKGAVNAVKDQGQCGSCWSFSVVGNVEGVNFLKNGELLSLSEQEICDCVTTSQGCKGGRPDGAMEYLTQHKMGLESESEYPYETKDDSCRAEQDEEKVFISDSQSIDGSNEDDLAKALMKYGPLSIVLNATPMQSYQGGVADPQDCDPQALDHAVVLVGFGEDGGQKYWTIRNSWAASWGEEGYYRLIYGKGACGMNTYVTTASVESTQTAVVV